MSALKNQNPSSSQSPSQVSKPVLGNVQKLQKVDLDEIVKTMKAPRKATIKEILQGKLGDLIAMVVSPDRLTEEGREFLEKNFDRTYLLLVIEVDEGNGITREDKILVNLSYHKNSNLMALYRKYKKLETGMTIDVIYDPEKNRYKLYLEDSDES